MGWDEGRTRVQLWVCGRKAHRNGDMGCDEGRTRVQVLELDEGRTRENWPSPYDEMAQPTPISRTDTAERFVGISIRVK